MKMLVTAAFAAATLASIPAEARPGYRGGHYSHPRPRVVFYAPLIAAPLYYGSRYYYPPAYYPPAPVTYIEQQAPGYGTVPPSASSWYYCPTSRAYYPHVQSCATGWQAVPPQPPSGY